MREHSDLTLAQLERIDLSMTVPCLPRETRRGCGVSAGHQCVSLATGRPLGGLGAHVDRLDLARLTLDVRTPRQPRRGRTLAPTG